MATAKTLAARGMISDRQAKKRGLGEERGEVCRALQMSLADTIDLWSQCKVAHWNVTGPNFVGAHRLLDEVAEAVEGLADKFAERLRQLGDGADGRVQTVARTSAVEPLQSADPASQETYLKAISSRLGQQAARFQAAIEEAQEAKDQVTANIFTDAAETIEQQAYLIDSHLQGDHA